MLIVSWNLAYKKHAENSTFREIFGQMGNALLYIIQIPVRFFSDFLLYWIKSSASPILGDEGRPGRGFEWISTLLLKKSRKSPVSMAIEHEKGDWLKNHTYSTHFLLFPKDAGFWAADVIGKEIEYTHRKSVTLFCLDCEIIQISNETQPIQEKNPTTWVWKVTPKRAGIFKLEYTIHGYVSTEDGGDFMYQDTIPTFVRVKGVPKEEASLWVRRNFRSISTVTLGILLILLGYYSNGFPGLAKFIADILGVFRK